MLTSHFCEIVKLIIQSDLLTKDALSGMLNMSNEELEQVLRGNTENITIQHIDNFTSCLGLQVFENNFWGQVLNRNPFRHYYSDSISEENKEIGNSLRKIWILTGEGSNAIKKRLERHKSNQKYLEGCQMMLEAITESNLETSNSDG